jgi:uroporphyrinogen decarboxylase
MLSRREFFVYSAAAAMATAATKPLTCRERVDRALKGEEVDRTPFSYWHHFLDEDKPPEDHARSTLEFHRKFHTDVVKVMSDYPYPKPKAEWFELREDSNPFPKQIRALELIRDGVSGQAHILETVFNPYQICEKLSSKEAVEKLRAENPQRLVDALEIIGKSEANHARRAIRAGASGIFLSITNSTDPEYAKFSAPFDRMVLEAVGTAPLNTLHIHGDKIALEHFYSGWPAAALNYSPDATGMEIAAVRQKWQGVIMAGLDENNYRKLQPEDIKRSWAESTRAAGRRFIFTPGCSVPNDTTDEELLRVTRFLRA